MEQMEIELTERSVLSRAEHTAFRELEGKMFIVGATTSKLVMLNETGTAVWNYLEQPRTLAEIADNLTAEFEVEREAALEDSLAFAKTLVEKELAEVG